MNKNIQRLPQAESLSTEHVDALCSAFARIALMFGLPRQELAQSLDRQIVKEAINISPDASNVELSIRTGIDRRLISSYRKGQSVALKPNRTTMILAQLKALSQKIGSTRIRKNGPFQSFTEICQQWSNGIYTPQSVLNELTRLGCLEDDGEYVVLNSADHIDSSNATEYFGMAANILNRLSSTLSFNKERTDVAEKLFQMSAISTQIPEHNRAKAHNEIKSKLNVFFKEIIETLEKFEDDSRPGSHAPIGVSLTEFDEKK